eukprot:1144765-Pelagomonas_calceolata.AAC.1
MSNLPSHQQVTGAGKPDFLVLVNLIIQIKPDQPRKDVSIGKKKVVRLGPGMMQRKKNCGGRGNSPHIRKERKEELRGRGKGDTLAQRSRESPPPQSCKTESANGDLEGYCSTGLLLAAPGVMDRCK